MCLSKELSTHRLRTNVVVEGFIHFLPGSLGIPSLLWASGTSHSFSAVTFDLFLNNLKNQELNKGSQAIHYYLKQNLGVL